MCRPRLAAGSTEGSEAAERSDGGRGFGYTGGHFHRNWGDANNRKLFLNALLWTAKAEIPEHGIETKVSDEDLAQNLDPKGRRTN